MKRNRLVSLVLVFALLMGLCTIAAGCSGTDENTLVIYNWGQYTCDGTNDSENLIEKFEQETGYKVVLRFYESNEELYGLMTSGALRCDLIIPSDYMIGRLREEGYLSKLNFENIPNYSYIMEDYKNLAYDPRNEYSVPYTWGTTGLIYNTKTVSPAPTSWDVLWDPAYKGEVLMFRNCRDAFAVAEAKLGYSINTTDEAELRAAAEELKKLKSNWQGLVMDEVFEKMEGNNAALAPYYAGDYMTMKEINEDLGFVHPVEGVNIFVDAMCVPANAANQEAAEAFINFILEPENNAITTEFLGYSSCNSEARKLLDAETLADPVMYPSEEVLSKAEAFNNLPAETNQLMNELWLEITNG